METTYSHITGSSVYIKNSDIVCRNILDETILVPICGHLADMQNIFSLEPVGAFIWDNIDGQSDLTAILQHIQNEFDVDAEQAKIDLAEFINELIQAELITLAQS